MSGAIAVGQDFPQGIRWGRRVRRVAVYRPAVEAPLGGSERVLP